MNDKYTLTAEFPGYCENCPHMSIKSKGEVIYTDNIPYESSIALACENKYICSRVYNIVKQEDGD